MQICILGVCGTFMGSVAVLAQALGHRVLGVDANTYPPMSTMLQSHGVALCEGYENYDLNRHNPDLVIIGNALSRGNPAVEYVLDSGLDYCSGPEWLAREILVGKTVLAVAGTHGKTTTASMLAWILECAGKAPGFLIGGVPENFGVSARIGGGEYFVIEADEYDSAFFDKRSKFIHYRPNIAILNNLEFDHADIFDDLAAIQRQFHHLVRTIPSSGCIVLPDETALREVLVQGVWSRLDWLTGAQSDWRLGLSNDDASIFEVSCSRDVDDENSDVKLAANQTGRVSWSLCGEHNALNALAAIAASSQVGVDVPTATQALSDFVSVKRRLQLLVEVNDIILYDDFAHHPTAIRLTLNAVSRKHHGRRILGVVEPRSNTMRMGIHDDKLSSALRDANHVWWYSEAKHNGDGVVRPDIFQSNSQITVSSSIADIVDSIRSVMCAGDVIVVMSNGGFGGIHQLLADAVLGVGSGAGSA